MEKINLSEYRTNEFSQFGEDGVVKKLMEIAGIKDGWLVEFGAWEGTYMSNARHHYLSNLDFNLFMAESEWDRFCELSKNYPDRRAVLSAATITTGNINMIFDSEFDSEYIKNIALLSIDVDGEDLNIWNALDKVRFRPKIVIIEYGKWKDGLWELVESFTGAQYTLVCITGNFIFVANELGITSMHTPNELMLSCGMEEYDLHNGFISQEEQKSRTLRQKTEKDLYKHIAKPQYIQYEARV